MEPTNKSRFARTIGIIASIATIIGVGISVFAWLLPFDPIGSSPLSPQLTTPVDANSLSDAEDDPLLTHEEITAKLTINANQYWQGTGVILMAGEIISIEYQEGLWTWTKEYTNFDAEGDPKTSNTCGVVCTTISDQCPKPDMKVGVLVGKIAEENFFIGNNLQYTVPANISNGQELYLMMNDCVEGLHDNDGYIQVEIAISNLD